MMRLHRTRLLPMVAAAAALLAFMPFASYAKPFDIGLGLGLFDRAAVNLVVDLVHLEEINAQFDALYDEPTVEGLQPSRVGALQAGYYQDALRYIDTATVMKLYGIGPIVSHRSNGAGVHAMAMPLLM